MSTAVAKPCDTIQKSASTALDEGGDTFGNRRVHILGLVGRLQVDRDGAQGVATERRVVLQPVAAAILSKAQQAVAKFGTRVDARMSTAADPVEGQQGARAPNGRPTWCTGRCDMYASGSGDLSARPSSMQVASTCQQSSNVAHSVFCSPSRAHVSSTHRY